MALQRLLGVSAAGYLGEMIDEIKSCQLEVKASKSDKWLRSYDHLCNRVALLHLKICMVSDPCWVHMGVSLTLTIEGAGAYSSPLRRLLEKKFDNPDTLGCQPVD